MALDFTAIDFETANPSTASACAVGLARVRSGRVVARASWLIQPPPGHDEFADWNVRFHGIGPEDVAGAKRWTDQLDDLAAFAGADVLVAHNAGFDMSVLKRACDATGDACPPYRYMCSLQVSRKVYDLESYRLPLVATAAGFGAFPHHDPGADAHACAQIIIDSARRVGARDVHALAEIVGVKVSQIAVPEAEEARPRSLSERSETKRTQAA